MTTISSEPSLPETKDYKLVIRETTDDTVPPEARRMYMIVNKTDGVVGGRGNILSYMIYSLYETQKLLDKALSNPHQRELSQQEQNAVQQYLLSQYTGGQA